MACIGIYIGPHEHDSACMVVWQGAKMYLHLYIAILSASCQGSFANRRQIVLLFINLYLAWVWYF